RHHPGDVRGVLSEPQRHQRDAPADAAKRHPVRGDLQRADHHRADPVGVARGQIPPAEREPASAAQSCHLRRRRCHRALHRDQGHRRVDHPYRTHLRTTAMLKELRPGIMMVVLFTALTGIIYPLAMTGIAQVIFPWQANGSLVEKDGMVVGSALIGQNFADDKYFHGRPSAITAPDPNDPKKTVDTPYDAQNSMGSNLGPTSKALVDRVTDAAGKLKKENNTSVPVDLVTTSGS